MFESIQLIPASSGHDMHSAQKDKAHLPNIRKETGVEYRDMLFFDDEAPNITKASSRRPQNIMLLNDCLHSLCDPDHPLQQLVSHDMARACRLLYEQGLCWSP